MCLCVCGVHIMCVCRRWLPCVCSGHTMYVCGVWAYLCLCGVHTVVSWVLGLLCVCGVFAFLCVCGSDTMCVCVRVAFLSMCGGYTMCLCGVFFSPVHVWCLHHVCMCCVGFPMCVWSHTVCVCVGVASLYVCWSHHICSVWTFLCGCGIHTMYLWCLGTWVSCVCVVVTPCVCVLRGGFIACVVVNLMCVWWVDFICVYVCVWCSHHVCM